MTWIFLGDTAPSKIFVGDTQVSKVFVWDTQVRPTWWGGRQPWANTKLYLPLDWDVIDYSSYSRTFTVYWATASVWTPVFDTLSSGKQVADFIATNHYNSNWFMFINNPTNIPNSWNMTLSFWICSGGSTSTYQEIVSYRGNNFYRMSMLGDDLHYLFHGSAQENTSFILTVWTWYHIVNVVENWVCTIYCNSNQIYSDSYSYWSGSDKLCIGAIYDPNWTNLRSEAYNWKLSEVIIEDKARTAIEISNYYDQTKWDYWIS